jgi:hypothetical protein
MTASDKDLMDRLDKMSPLERVLLLDPICEAIRLTYTSESGVIIYPNRIFALKVLDLYEEWQQEMWNRD